MLFPLHEDILAT